MRTPFSSFWPTLLVWFSVSFNACFAETLLVFSAEWCGNCVKFKKDLGEGATKLDGVPIEFVDFDANRRQARQLGVRSIPTFILMDDDGDEVARKVGYGTMTELTEWLNARKK